MTVHLGQRRLGCRRQHAGDHRRPGDRGPVRRPVGWQQPHHARHRRRAAAGRHLDRGDRRPAGDVPAVPAAPAVRPGPGTPAARHPPPPAGAHPGAGCGSATSQWAGAPGCSSPTPPRRGRGDLGEPRRRRVRRRRPARPAGRAECRPPARLNARPRPAAARTAPAVRYGRRRVPGRACHRAAQALPAHGRAGGPLDDRRAAARCSGSSARTAPARPPPSSCCSASPGRPAARPWCWARRPATARPRRQIGYLPELFRFQSWLTAREVLILHCRLLRLPRPAWPPRPSALHVRRPVRPRRRQGRRPSRRACSSGSASAWRCSASRSSSCWTSRRARSTRWAARGPRIIRELRDRGTTVFLNTHLLEEAEHVCDRVTGSTKGRSVATGTLGELNSSRPASGCGSPACPAAGGSRSPPSGAGRRTGTGCWSRTWRPGGSRNWWPRSSRSAARSKPSYRSARAWKRAFSSCWGRNERG